MKNIPHILVVDDDFEDRMILAQTFSEVGCSSMVDYVDDSTLVMSHLATIRYGDISLIILDLNMPKLNGTEILQKIRNDEHFHDTPVIIFSTSVNEIERTRCMELGAKAYMTKPSDYMGYLETCRHFCELSRVG